MSPSSVLLSRRSVLSPLRIQSVLSLAADGKPTYATAVNVYGRARRESHLIAVGGGGISVGGGAQVRTELTIWVPRELTIDGEVQTQYQPVNDDRVVFESVAHIVVERKEVRDLDNNITHTRAYCRLE